MSRKLSGKLDVEVDLEAVEAAAARGQTLNFPQTAISDLLDRIVAVIGWIINWIWVPLVLLIVLNVVLRYILRTNFVALEELQWHLYAFGFMMGLAVALQADGHVRVDVLAERFSLRTRAWIELLGIVLILAPLCWILWSWGWPFVERSWRLNEVSSAPGGLPYRWVIKSVILLAVAFIALAALSRFLRVTAYLFGFPRPRPA